MDCKITFFNKKVLIYFFTLFFTICVFSQTYDFEKCTDWINNSHNTFSDFGTTDLTHSRTKNFTIQNLGAETLNLIEKPIDTISEVLVFTVLMQPRVSIILSTGSDLTFDVPFTQSDSGSVQAVILAKNNDNDKTYFEFTVKENSQRAFFDREGDGILDNILNP